MVHSALLTAGTAVHMQRLAKCFTVLSTCVVANAFAMTAVSPLPEPAASWTWGGWEYLVYMPSLGITDVDYLGGLSFDTAQATCEHVGGSLMSVESTPEHEAALANVASWSNNFSISAAIWVGVRAMVVLAGDDTSSTAKMSTDTATLKLEYVDGSERIWNGAGPPSAVLASALLQWQARWGTNTSTLNGTVSEGMSAGCVAWDVSPQSKGGPGTYIILPCKSRVSAFICKRTFEYARMCVLVVNFNCYGRSWKQTVLGDHHQ